MQDGTTKQLQLRTATNADMELIYRIIRDSLGPYIVQTWGSWDDVVQRKRFDEVTVAADHSIIELNHTPVGCRCIKIMNNQLWLIRLFVLPVFQNQGYGTEILREIIRFADLNTLPIRLRVLRVNPARRLYERHHFVVTEEDETHFTMVRLANKLTDHLPCTH